jgi:hypothetical protein
MAFTLAENEAGSPGDVVFGLIEAVGTVDTPAAYMSENKAPAAQLNWIGALRLFPSLPAASVLLVVFALTQSPRYRSARPVAAPVDR